VTLLLNIGILLLVGLGAWWLTGFDKTAGGESKRGYYFTRTLRCLAVVFLSAMFGLVLSSSGPVMGGIPFLIIIPVGIALLLRSSLSELFAYGFLGFLDPELHGQGEFDLKKSRRYQDAIGHLIRNGRRDEAIKLCEELKQSGEVDIVTLENVLEFLGVKQNRPMTVKPLVAVAQLRTQGKIADAELLLKLMLQKNPADDGAALMLMRLYAEDWRQPERAHVVLRALEKQPHVPASHLEFARRSIAEWSRPKASPPLPQAPPEAESIDDLLARGSFGTAVDRLEAQIKARPADFDLQLKLAEVHAVHCQNLPPAERIIGRLERAGSFEPEQIARARAKLDEWHARSKLRGAT
jgi:tetratricopeptide (TPR) repeat protein